MDKKTLHLMFADIEVALKELRILYLTRDIISALDKLNRARKLSVYNPLPEISYNIDHVEQLARAVGGRSYYRDNIIKLLTRLGVGGALCKI